MGYKSGSGSVSGVSISGIVDMAVVDGDGDGDSDRVEDSEEKEKEKEKEKEEKENVEIEIGAGNIDFLSILEREHGMPLAVGRVYLRRLRELAEGLQIEWEGGEGEWGNGNGNGNGKVERCRN
jgi:hypothetical protein